MISLSLLLLSAAPVQNAFEDLDMLEGRIAKYVGTAVRPIDRRLRLARCPQPADIISGGNAVTVRCAATGWQLHVPLALSQAAAPAQVTIRRGESVRVDISGESYAISHDAVATEDAAIGQPVRVKFGVGGRTLVATVTGPGKAQIAD